MEVTGKIADIRRHVDSARKEGRRVGFVPTMGYLHRGHMSLVDEARRHTDYQVMSIFVNRKQFNNPDDFRNYPKDLERDLALAEKAGVNLVFVPDDGEMYRDSLTTVHLDRMTEHLCGAHRPGHFDGVFLVVSKLFNIVQPQVAVFGQKDIQQALGIVKMVQDLNFPVEIIVAPIMRDDDGLAMSSRNKHLSPQQRERALMIHRSLREARDLLAAGERSSGAITERCRKILQEGSPEKIDYYSLVKYHDLSPADSVQERSVLAVAAYFGTTRLIDNMIIDFQQGKVACIF